MRRESACLVCIARNEGPYIVEWLAHHLALGFDQIVVYDHRSTDEMPRLLARIAERFPVSVVPVQSTLPLLCKPQRGNNLRRLLGHWSPQSLAYNHALGDAGRRHAWIAFFDCDEFLVLNRHDGLGAFLDSIGDEAGAIGINWLCFGSGGKMHRDERPVAQAFRRTAPPDWYYNRNFKTIVRVRDVLYMSVNRCVLRSGDYRSASNERLRYHRNMTDAVDHRVAQLNHYQLKSYDEWQKKVERGRATKHEWLKIRRWEKPDDRFQLFDRNEFESRSIDRHRERFESVYEAMKQAVHGRC